MINGIYMKYGACVAYIAAFYNYSCLTLSCFVQEESLQRISMLPCFTICSLSIAV